MSDVLLLVWHMHTSAPFPLSLSSIHFVCTCSCTTAGVACCAYAPIASTHRHTRQTEGERSERRRDLSLALALRCRCLAIKFYCHSMHKRACVCVRQGERAREPVSVCTSATSLQPRCLCFSPLAEAASLWMQMVCSGKQAERGSPEDVLLHYLSIINIEKMVSLSLLTRDGPSHSLQERRAEQSECLPG